MSFITDLNALRQKRKDIIDGAGAMLTKAHAENKRSLTAEEETEWHTRHTEGDDLLKQIQRLERQIDADASLQGMPRDKRTAGREDFSTNNRSEGEKSDRDKMHEQAYCAFVRGGPDSMSDEQRSEMRTVIKEQPAEIRALSAVTGASGAYAVPQGFSGELEVATRWFGGLTEAADYMDTDSGNVIPWPTENDTFNTGEIDQENQPVSGGTGGAAENDPAFGVVNFYAYMISSGIVKLPVQLLDDTAFKPETWTNEMLNIRIKRRVNYKATNGSGANEPTGLLTVAPVGVTTASATAFTYNELLTLEHAVDPSYRQSKTAAWMFHDQTLLALKKLTDSNGRPLFISGGVSQGIQAGPPDTIDGFPYWINQDFPQITNSAKTIAFGDMKKFKIRRVKNAIMVRMGERFIDQLQIGFLAAQRFDTNLLDAGMHPIQILQMHS